MASVVHWDRKTVRSSRTRTAFTLVETLVVVGLSTVVLGSFIQFFIHGNQRFQHTSDHSAMRAEALRCLETIGRDLEQLVVDNDMKWQDTGNFMLVEPFRVTDIYPETVFGPVPGETIAGRSLSLYRYHHVEMISDPSKGQVIPQVVGQRVDYVAKLVDAANPARGMNLLRNGRVVNGQPLRQIIFQKVPPVVAIKQVQGSPNAFLDVVVVPMADASVARPRIEMASSAVLRRQFHLIGYESQYTTILNLAIERVQSNAVGAQQKTEDDLLDPFMLAVLRDAQTHARGNFLYEDIVDRIKKGNTLGYRMPEKTVRIDTKPFDDATANTDSFFTRAASDIKEVDPSTLAGEGLQVSQGGFGAQEE